MTSVKASGPSLGEGAIQQQPSNHQDPQKLDHPNDEEDDESEPTAPVEALEVEEEDEVEAATTAAAAAAAQDSDIVKDLGFAKLLELCEEARGTASRMDHKVWLALYKATLMEILDGLSPSLRKNSSKTHEGIEPRPSWIPLSEIHILLSCGGNSVKFPLNVLINNFNSLEQAVIWAGRHEYISSEELIEHSSKYLRSNRSYVNILKAILKAFNLPEPAELVRYKTESFLRYLMRSQDLSLISVAELFVGGTDLHLEVIYEFAVDRGEIKLAREIWDDYINDDLKKRLKPPPPPPPAWSPKQGLLTKSSLDHLMFARFDLRAAKLLKDESEIPKPLLNFMSKIQCIITPRPHRWSPGHPPRDEGSMDPWNPFWRVGYLARDLLKNLEVVDDVERLTLILRSEQPSFICVDCEWPSTELHGESDSAISLMQISYLWLNQERLLLIDLETLKDSVQLFKDQMIRFFNSCYIIGVNFLQSDLHRLQRFFGYDLQVKYYIELASIVRELVDHSQGDLPPLNGYGIEKCFQVFMPNTQLPKQYAFSNWKRRPLLAREAWYAATDVIIPLYIYKLAIHKGINIRKLKAKTTPKPSSPSLPANEEKVVVKTEEKKIPAEAADKGQAIGAKSPKTADQVVPLTDQTTKEEMPLAETAMAVEEAGGLDEIIVTEPLTVKVEETITLEPATAPAEPPPVTEQTKAIEETPVTIDQTKDVEDASKTEQVNEQVSVTGEVTAPIIIVETTDTERTKTLKIEPAQAIGEETTGTTESAMQTTSVDGTPDTIDRATVTEHTITTTNPTTPIIDQIIETTTTMVIEQAEPSETTMVTEPVKTLEETTTTDHAAPIVDTTLIEPAETVKEVMIVSEQAKLAETTGAIELAQTTDEAKTTTEQVELVEGEMLTQPPTTVDKAETEQASLTVEATMTADEGKTIERNEATAARTTTAEQATPAIDQTTAMPAAEHSQTAEYTPATEQPTAIEETPAAVDQMSVTDQAATTGEQAVADQASQTTTKPEEQETAAKEETAAEQETVAKEVEIEQARPKAGSSVKPNKRLSKNSNAKHQNYYDGRWGQYYKIRLAEFERGLPFKTGIILRNLSGKRFETNSSLLCSALRLCNCQCQLWSDANSRVKAIGPPAVGPQRESSLSPRAGVIFLLREDVRGPDQAYWKSGRICRVIFLKKDAGDAEAKSGQHISASLVQLVKARLLGIHRIGSDEPVQDGGGRTVGASRERASSPAVGLKSWGENLVVDDEVVDDYNTTSRTLCPLCGVVLNFDARQLMGGAPVVSCSSCAFWAGAEHVRFVRWKLLRTACESELVML